MKIPTDLQILSAIYEEYYSSFASSSAGKSDRREKMYVPIDCARIAKMLKVDGDIVFGRLHLHLEEKYGYEKENRVKVPFFIVRFDKDRHCVNFPLLASVLAGLRAERRQFWTVSTIAGLAVIVSAASFVVSVISLWLSL